jgi:hypothetical protein
MLLDFTMNAIIKLQDTIEAIDRAILDEDRMATNDREPEIPPGCI